MTDDRQLEYIILRAKWTYYNQFWLFLDLDDTKRYFENKYDILGAHQKKQYSSTRPRYCANTKISTKMGIPQYQNCTLMDYYIHTSTILYSVHCMYEYNVLLYSSRVCTCNTN